MLADISWHVELWQSPQNNYEGFCTRHCQLVRRLQAAGKLPGSVLTRYDLLGTYVRGRLQHAY